MNYCITCGAQIDSDVRFCMACGSKTQIDAHDPVPGTFGFIKSSLRKGFVSIRQFFKNPKQIIPMIVLSTCWLILSMLASFGINPLSVQVLSFFSFAQGGLYGGILGAIGGVFGKAVFAYFISAMILPLFTGKKSFKGASKGFKAFFSGLAVNSILALSQMIAGFGLALVIFNFLTGNASTVNSMAGVVGFILALKSLGQRSGFIWGMLLSVANKLARGRMPSQTGVSRVLAGYAAGSIAGVALSALPISFLPYLLGALLLIVGAILGIVKRPAREAASV